MGGTEERKTVTTDEETRVEAPWYAQAHESPASGRRKRRRSKVVEGSHREDGRARKGCTCARGLGGGGQGHVDGAVVDCGREDEGPPARAGGRWLAACSWLLLVIDHDCCLHWGPRTRAGLDIVGRPSAGGRRPNAPSPSQQARAWQAAGPGRDGPQAHPRTGAASPPPPPQDRPGVALGKPPAARLRLPPPRTPTPPPCAYGGRGHAQTTLTPQAPRAGRRRQAPPAGAVVCPAAARARARLARGGVTRGRRGKAPSRAPPPHPPTAALLGPSHSVWRWALTRGGQRWQQRGAQEGRVGGGCAGRETEQEGAAWAPPRLGPCLGGGWPRVPLSLPPPPPPPTLWPPLEFHGRRATAAAKRLVWGAALGQQQRLKDWARPCCHRRPAAWGLWAAATR